MQDETIGTESGPRAELDRFPVDRRLRCLLGDPLPASERELWLAMSKDQRERAMSRMKAIVRWQTGRRLPRPADAAIAAGVPVNQFYELAKQWKGRRSLTSLEVLAAAPRVRSRGYEAVLTRLVKEVVDRNADGRRATAKELAESLGEAAADELKTAPSFATLRRRVQEELRIRDRMERPGTHLQFDCCAATMSTLEEPARTLFAVIDRRTQLVLGIALGRPREARLGYAAAAADALRRLPCGPYAKLAWSPRLENAELVVGVDDDLRMVGVESVRADVRPPIQPSISPKRFGRYLRQAAGQRMGRILFLPNDTVMSEGYDSVPDLDGGSDDAARFQVEIELHNAAIMAGLKVDETAEPPAAVIAILRFLSGWRA